MVAGELDGNVESASRVELLESGALSGDIKAGTLTVAAGSRIRGHVECGWSDKDAPKSNGKDDKAEREIVSCAKPARARRVPSAPARTARTRNQNAPAHAPRARLPPHPTSTT